jgi:hypothetical protein
MLNNEYIMFLVKTRLTQDCDDVVLVKARDREDAKRQALPFLGHYANEYVVEPLTRRTDNVIVSLSFALS